MKEANQSVVTIQEVNGDILQSLVSFCYTGQIAIDDQNVDGILAAASFMEFIEIERFCEEFYIDLLSYKNCLGLWLLADQYNLEELKEKAKIKIMDTF